ncbi:transcription elongation factor GreA [Bacteroidia bacterium]|nr:transcription elongation factor GreA [Bacteroidia bacterium]
MEKKPISRAGWDALNSELTRLREHDRPELLHVVQVARDLGDLSENAEYQSSREKLRFMDKRIAYLESAVGSAQIIDTTSLSGDRVTFGARVIAVDEDGNRLQCQILSDIEADGKTVIACTSPVGRALIGKCVGDNCIVRLPGGEREYEILEVKF